MFAIKHAAFWTAYVSTLLVLWLAFFDRKSGLKFVNPLSFLALLYFARNHVIIPVVYYSGGTYKQLMEVSQDTLFFITVFNLLFSLFVFSFVKSRLYGMFVAELRRVNTSVPSPSRSGWYVVFTLASLAMASSLYRLLDGSALLTLLSGGDAGDARVARLQFYMEGAYVLGIPLKYLNILFLFVELLFVYSLMLSLRTGRLISWLSTLFIFLSLLLWHLSNTSKGYIVVIFFYSFIIVSLINGFRYRIGRAIKYGLIAILPATFLTYYFMGTDGFLFWYPLERLFAANFLPHYVIFYNYNIDNFLWGSTVPSWYTLGQHEQFLLAEWNWRWMNDKLGSDLAYNNPSSFVAELFANFGYFSPVFWGFVFSYILFATIVAIRIVPSGFKSVYLVFLTFYFSKFSAKEFMPTIFDYKLLTLIIVSVVFFWVFQRYFSRVS